MRLRTIIPRSQRLAALAVAVVVHLLLFALFISIGSRPTVVVAPAGAMSLIALAPAHQQGQPPPALPSKIADPKRIISQDSFSIEQAPSPPGAGDGCTTFELVAKSLLAEPAAVAGVASTPLENRSIAGAVVIWNAGWSDTASAPAEPLGPARIVIEQNLRSIPDLCLDEPMAGPRLVPMPEGERTIFLAIGSGNWTWRQLITDPPPALQGGVQSGDQPVRSVWDWF